jgi:hypothetical protein
VKQVRIGVGFIGSLISIVTNRVGYMALRKSAEKYELEDEEATYLVVNGKRIREIKIDLNDLSDILPPFQESAATMLRNILECYDVNILVMIDSNFDETIIEQDYEGIAEKIFEEEEDNRKAIKKIAIELAEKRNKDITIVKLYVVKHYVYAVAFVEPKD